jgi:hypothetical protein
MREALAPEGDSAPAAVPMSFAHWSCARCPLGTRRRSEPPARTGKTTNRGVSDPPISPVRPFMPRPRRVAHAPCVASLSDPAATERACLAPGLAVRNRRVTAFIYREGHQLPPTLSLPLARLSGRPRHRDHLHEVPHGAPQRRERQPRQRPGPSRGGWWARSRSRQGASLTLGPRRRRGFGLDGSLDRAEDRQLRDGPGQVRALTSHRSPTTTCIMPDPNDDELVPERVTITRCRELLGDEAVELSDEDVDAIRRHVHAMAHTLIDVFLQRPDHCRG